MFMKKTKLFRSWEGIIKPKPQLSETFLEGKLYYLRGSISKNL